MSRISKPARIVAAEADALQIEGKTGLIPRPTMEIAGCMADIVVSQKKPYAPIDNGRVAPATENLLDLRTIQKLFGSASIGLEVMNVGRIAQDLPGILDHHRIIV
ncbi:MAG: hypothetical protein V9H69_03730 [Anaerolineae bacterium]